MDAGPHAARRRRRDIVVAVNEGATLLSTEPAAARRLLKTALSSSFKYEGTASMIFGSFYW